MSVLDRLIDKRGPDECWPWLGSFNNYGYGRLGKQYAHRLVWERDRGMKAGHWRIRHRCDNPKCCNPRHLYRGTQSHNMNEAFARGRVRCTKDVPKPHVQGSKNGHARLTEAGVLWARRVVLSGEVKLAEASAKLGVAPSTLCVAVQGKTWRHV